MLRRVTVVVLYLDSFALHAGDILGGVSVERMRLVLVWNNAQRRVRHCLRRTEWAQLLQRTVAKPTGVPLATAFSLELAFAPEPCSISM